MPASTDSHESYRSLRVLVAEDDPMSQRLVQTVLAQRGHKLVITANGREALATLERERFDVVLMDLQMPEMNGLQATAEIREREKLTGAHIPILALTAHSGREDRERCAAAGMDGYLSKPIDFPQLIEWVENATAAGQPFQPAKTVVDGGILRSELNALFVADAAQIGAEILAACARRDAAALQASAHRLRGTAGYFAAQRTLELTARLEELGRAGEFTPDTEKTCDELAEELARLQRALAGSTE
jgi:CheY-like chemotaxis protein/HPt (histidine-containing phosphotransfer) domain-containing protein